MTRVWVLYHFAKADFLERVRRYSFFVTLVATLGLSCLSVPPPDSKVATVALNDIRGIYNTPWVAAMLAIMCSCFLSLIGFYLVKNSLERDRQTRVGEILTSSPVSSFGYLLGKTLSNFVLLGTLVMVVMLTAVIMQFIRGESSAVLVGHLIAPFVVMVLPCMAVIAALAVLFETLPVLRGTWGNVIWFFLWAFLLIASVGPSADRQNKIQPARNDLTGMTLLLNSMTAQALKEYPDYNGQIEIGASVSDRERAVTRTIVWNGLRWTPSVVFARIWWLIVAIGVVGLASVLYRRQKYAGGTSAKRVPIEVPVAVTEKSVGPKALHMHLRPLREELRFSIRGLVVGEMRLAFHSVGRYWYLAAGGLILAEFLAPADISRRWLLPIAWMWPLSIWSAMGCRERISGIGPLIFSSVAMKRRQIPALLVAGSIVALVTGSGVLLRLGLAGDWGGMSSLVTGAVLIPAVAISSGIVSGGRRLFEVVYTMVWYVGLLNGVPQLDFGGVTAESARLGVPVYSVAIALILLLTAWVKRIRETD